MGYSITYHEIRATPNVREKKNAILGIVWLLM
jgi:hypothetical protein